MCIRDSFRCQLGAVAGLFVEFAENGPGRIHGVGVPGQVKLVAAVQDFHVQPLCDLLDVLIQAATEAGQSTGIVGFEADVL